MAKLHGYTRITLRNPISGNILKDIESENTFQGAKIAAGMRNLGVANASILAGDDTRLRALWSQYVGGLFLFQNSITEGDSYMSAGNKMIGNGSWNVTNNQEPNELGSFNSIESSASASAVTQVYDFSTQQANGQISCVALTSRLGGLIGYGNPSGKVYTAADVEWSQYLTLYKSINPLDAEDGGHRCIIGNKYYRFNYDSTTHKMTVHKWNVPLTQGSVFDWLDDSSTLLDMSSFHYSTIFENAYSAWSPVPSGGKIYFIPQDWFNIAVGGTIYYIEYNPANGTLTEKSFTNSLSVALVGRYINIAHGLLFFTIHNSYKIEVFDATTSVHVRTLETPDDAQWNNFRNGGEFPNGLVVLTGVVSSNSTTKNVTWFYDTVNDTFYPANASGVYGICSDASTPLFYDATAGAIWNSRRYDLVAVNNPLYLATINNLQSPVTKTAAQTMKVTYTLTEA
jgi:hypothetical protein